MSDQYLTSSILLITTQVSKIHGIDFFSMERVLKYLDSNKEQGTASPTGLQDP